MNVWTSALVWGCVQVTLFSAIAAVMYLAVRRRGPAAGSHFILWSLAVVIGMTALAVSPWPTWRRVASGSSTSASVAAPQVDKPGAVSEGDVKSDAGPVDDIALDATPSTAAPGAESPLAAAWQSFVEGLRQPPAEETWSWPSALAALLIAGICLAIVRLVGGLLVVGRYRRTARPITDPALTALASHLRAELDCRADVELGESQITTSPATIGWRRPLVLLPASWREWTDQERRVVLSHELAHVARRDYVASIWAQLGVALHFYNPLVRWLASRLRLEQEIAADAAGAAISGGQQTYLATLAAMALKQDDRRLSWAARPFLPARGALLRRIETLRDTPLGNQKPFATVARRALAVTLLLLGLVVAGVRGPAVEIAAAADPPPAAPGASAAPVATAETLHTPFDLTYVSDNPVCVIGIRPSELAKQPGIGELLKIASDSAMEGNPTAQRLDFADLEQVVFAVVIDDKSSRPAPMITLKSKAAIDWKKTPLCDPNYSTEITAKADGTRVPGDVRASQFYYVADDRTLLFADQAQTLVPIVVRGKNRAAAAWEKDWRRFEQNHLAIVIDSEKLRPILKEGVNRMPNGAMLGGLAVYIESLKWVIAEARVTDEKGQPSFGAQALLVSLSEKQASETATSLKALLPAAAEILKLSGAQLERVGKNQPPGGAAGTPAGALSEIDESAVIGRLIVIAQELVKNAQVATTGPNVELSTSAPINDLASLISSLLPAVHEARKGARKSQSQNLIKQICLAMLNYEAAHKTYPAAYTAKDGKPLLSWRVAMLPYLEEQALYKEFHQDEPWDSEHNKKLIPRMPALYRSPASTVAREGRTVYVVPRGKDTMFPNDGKALRLRQITDGSSNTLLVVETDDAHAVVWTKPDDWEFDVEHPSAGVGGQYPGVINIGFCDGHVLPVPASTDAPTWKACVTPAGGEKYPPAVLPPNN